MKLELTINCVLKQTGEKNIALKYPQTQSRTNNNNNNKSNYHESKVVTYSSRAQEDIKDLLLSDWLVSGLWIGLGCWSEDGIDVGIN